MESGFENFLNRQELLNHVKKLNLAYSMNVSEIQPRLFFVNGSDNHKRNIVIFLKMVWETCTVISNHCKN